MKTRPPITCLFVDIGGVLLTDGWDRRIRTQGLGIRCVLHEDYASTRAMLASLGLTTVAEARHRPKRTIT